MTSSSEAAPQAAPTRYISSRRAARQAARVEQRQEVARNLRVGFGRAQLRHADPTPDLPDPDKEENVVWLDIVFDHPTKKTTRFTVNCIDCGTIACVYKRKQALEQCHGHLQEKHPGVIGRIRKDVV